MNIQLRAANIDNSEQLYKMQILGFKALLEKYHDYNTNPGAETLEKVRQRFSFNTVDHYIICLDAETIGYIRIRRLDEDICALSQICVLPDFQGKGYAQEAIKQLELLYPYSRGWVLDTIKQEAKLCHLYEKLGYRLTGSEKNIKDGMDIVDYAK